VATSDRRSATGKKPLAASRRSPVSLIAETWHLRRHLRPPHLGHLILREAHDQLGLDRLLSAYSGPPHKQGEEISPLAHRLKWSAGY
jgi:hypothetical protein